MVQPVNIFDIAAKQANWLTARQNAVAANVANANTPNYKAIDVKPFSEVLSTKSGDASLGMLVTNKRHMDLGGSIQQIGTQAEFSDEVTTSGNNVNIEKEVNRGAEISQQMQFNTSIVRAFNEMYMKVIKG